LNPLYPGSRYRPRFCSRATCRCRSRSSGGTGLSRLARAPAWAEGPRWLCFLVSEKVGPVDSHAHVVEVGADDGVNVVACPILKPLEPPHAPPPAR
jgi:hypothetical protein